MTMLTSCASCGTAFRVTSEQLVAHQGKVRCGACNTVFSALENLIHTSPEALAADPNGNAGAAAVETASASAFSVASLASPDTTTATLVLGAAPLPVLSAAPMLVVDDDLIVPLANPQSSVPMAEAAVQDTAPEEANLGEVSAPKPLADTPSPAVTAATAATAASATPAASFAWWSTAGAFVALCALTLQGAYFYRNELAAHVPETKPALAALCQQLGCAFAAPRDAQAITIESHDLQAEPANKSVLALIALLRNRAAFAQDAPHLELTLTDAQDAALARRVFTPREYVAAAQMAPNSELPVRIMLDASQIKAAGYRLYAFYP